jgi:hypothetical protein
MKTPGILKIPGVSRREDSRSLKEFEDLVLRYLDIPSNYQYLFSTPETKFKVIRQSGYFVPAFSVFVYFHEMNRTI